MELNDLTDARVVITGANTGIGRVTARELARVGAEVVLVGRSRDRTLGTIAEISALSGSEPEFIAMDLANLESVRAAAAGVRAMGAPIDILINNAGVAGLRGVTQDGFENHFGINHLGHYLFTRLLVDQVAAASDPRIVTVASRASTRVRSFSLDHVRTPTRSKTGFPEYCHSKLANVLFSAELARRTGLRTYSLHPGVVATDIWRQIPAWAAAIWKRFFMISVEEGAQTSLCCAASPECAGDTGLYYSDCAIAPPNPLVNKAELPTMLWEKSAEWVGLAAD